LAATRIAIWQAAHRRRAHSGKSDLFLPGLNVFPDQKVAFLLREKRPGEDIPMLVEYSRIFVTQRKGRGRRLPEVNKTKRSLELLQSLLMAGQTFFRPELAERHLERSVIVLRTRKNVLGWIEKVGFSPAVFGEANRNSSGPAIPKVASQEGKE